MEAVREGALSCPLPNFQLRPEGGVLSCSTLLCNRHGSMSSAIITRCRSCEKELVSIRPGLHTWQGLSECSSGLRLTSYPAELFSAIGKMTCVHNHGVKCRSRCHVSAVGLDHLMQCHCTGAATASNLTNNSSDLRLASCFPKPCSHKGRCHMEHKHCIISKKALQMSRPPSRLNWNL